MVLAKPYLAQIHLSNCVNDPNHPYYGDWHMDAGQASEYENWGYLTAEAGVRISRKLPLSPQKAFMERSAHLRYEAGKEMICGARNNWSGHIRKECLTLRVWSMTSDCWAFVTISVTWLHVLGLRFSPR